MKFLYKDLKFNFFKEGNIFVLILARDVLTEFEAEVLGFRRDIIFDKTGREIPGGWIKTFWEYSEFAKTFLHLDELKKLTNV